MPITLLQDIGTKDMAEAFNLNNFLQTYKTATYDPTKQHASAEEKMETRRLEQAEAAVNNGKLLTLTLSEKIAELGVGERVLKQVNLSLPLRQLVNVEILEKININNLILAKTIYLTNKISQNYKSCSFVLVSKYIKEYDELMVLKEKVININDEDEVIKIIKGGY